MLKKALMLLLVCCLEACAQTPISKDASSQQSYAEQKEVTDFIQYMVKKYHFDQSQLTSEFAKVTRREKVINKSNNQPEVITPYYEYRTRFIDGVHIRRGIEFAKRNREWLKKAEHDFGVDWPIIVSIIGVETVYGSVTGKSSVFASLTTLTFDYPRRGKFFRSELESYLLLSRKEGWKIGETLGSYSGALGMVQFMPSNYMKLAIDYDQDGHKDLWHSDADAIGSVAKYLHHFHWQKSGYTVSSCSIKNIAAVEEFINKGRDPKFSLAEWESKGVVATNNLDSSLKAGLIRLQDAADSNSCWLAFDNFFTIMKYNPSRRYAMSVLELANRIAQGVQL